MKTWIRVAVLAALSSGAWAQQHQNAFLYTHYDTPRNDCYNVDQYLRVDQKAQASFWPVLWKWQGASIGGYFGLQTDGSGPNGEPLGDAVLFSLWEANAVNPQAGVLSGTFGGEGTGYTLRRHFRIRTGRYYRLRVWRLYSEPAGHWWGAWILDTKTGVETFLGSIRSDAVHECISGQSVEDFSEYFGPAMPTCDSVPISVVRWSLPFVRSPGGDLEGTFLDSYRGSCTGGSAVLQPVPPLTPFFGQTTFEPSRLGDFRPSQYVVVTLGGAR